MAQISLNNVSKAYGSIKVLHDINLQISEGEFIVLVGPSGCGKSTLLRMIAGLEPITGGELRIGDKVVNEMAPRDRDIAMVFQSYALYPHMDVARNMGFGLEIRGEDKAERDKRVAEAAEILGLTPYLKRFPRALSGGQRQRVAMGRAIVRDPQAFLFDEPLSNLDAALRVEMRLEIAKLHHRLSATMIYVTHDQVEALTLADRIVVMNGGYIQQVGSPMELYNKPANLFVAKFIGSPTMNVMPAETIDSKALARLVGKNLKSQPAKIGIRPEHSYVETDAKKGVIQGKVLVTERLGSDTNIYVETDHAEQFLVRQDGDTKMETGAPVSISFDPEHMHFFDRNDRAIFAAKR